MGQYYIAVNLDKKEFIKPRAFGDGAKLLEFGSSGVGMMCGLAVLLADGNNRGGGDLQSEHPIIGSWAGCRIVIAGEYADHGKFVPLRPEEEDPSNLSNLYGYAHEHFKNVSDDVIEVLCADRYVAKAMLENDAIRARMVERGLEVACAADAEYRLGRKKTA